MIKFIYHIYNKNKSLYKTVLFSYLDLPIWKNTSMDL